MEEPEERALPTVIGPNLRSFGIARRVQRRRTPMVGSAWKLARTNLLRPDLSSFGIDPRLGEADEKLALFHDSGHFNCFSLGKLIVAFFGMPGQKEADFRRSYAFVLATPTPT